MQKSWSGLFISVPHWIGMVLVCTSWFEQITSFVFPFNSSIVQTVLMHYTTNLDQQEKNLTERKIQQYKKKIIHERERERDSTINSSDKFFKSKNKALDPRLSKCIMVLHAVQKLGEAPVTISLNVGENLRREVRNRPVLHAPLQVL